MIDEDGKPKITDIGIVKMYEPLHSNVDDATRWHAPELLTGEQDDFTAQSDIYSFACVCIEVRPPLRICFSN